MAGWGAFWVLLLFPEPGFQLGDVAEIGHVAGDVFQLVFEQVLLHAYALAGDAFRNFGAAGQVELHHEGELDADCVELQVLQVGFDVLDALFELLAGEVCRAGTSALVQFYLQYAQRNRVSVDVAGIGLLEQRRLLLRRHGEDDADQFGVQFLGLRLVFSFHEQETG